MTSITKLDFTSSSASSPPESGGGGAAVARPARAMHKYVCEDKYENLIGLINADTCKVTIAGGGHLKTVAAAPQWRQAPVRSSDHTDDSMYKMHRQVCKILNTACSLLLTDNMQWDVTD